MGVKPVVHIQEEVAIQVGTMELRADLNIPAEAKAIIVFAHGSGSSRFSPRNRLVARAFNGAGLATLLLDSLSLEEQRQDELNGHLRFDIDLLASRLVGAIDHVRRDSQTRGVKIGIFGASTGAAAALQAAAQRPAEVGAIVSRGGRPDLAGRYLSQVRAPVLLIVGGNDLPVVGLNQEACRQIPGTCEVCVVPGASHLFEEPGKLEEVADLARDWFLKYLPRGDKQAA